MLYSLYAMSQITYNQETLMITHVVRSWRTAVRGEEPVSEALLKKYAQLQKKGRAKLHGADPVALVRQERE